MSAIEKFVRKRFTGVSWKNRYINSVFHLLDIPDEIIRRVRGLDDLPKYSVRVRSMGVKKQFGGRRFARSGTFLAQLLIDRAGLDARSTVLEIGCGCGRVALALTRMLNDGNYTGMDIDAGAIAACRDNPLLTKRGFRFDRMDIQNSEWNPCGTIPARSYRFPYPDEGADVIFLISVFTHMLPDDVSNYIREIGRMLRPGGNCLFTAFLMDYGYEGKRLDFPYEHGPYRVHQESLPEKAVGYFQSFFQEACSSAGLTLKDSLLGDWRLSAAYKPTVSFGQDVMVVAK